MTDRTGFRVVWVVHPAGHLLHVIQLFIHENSDGTEQIRIYPNPSKEVVFIEITSKHNDEITLTLYDALGNPVINNNHSLKAVAINLIPVNISNFHPGIYFIAIKGMHIELALRNFLFNN